MKMVKLTEDHYVLVDDTRKEMYTIPTSQAKELLGVVDVHKKALAFTKEIGGTHEQGLAFIDGYYQALEDNKERKYTNKDIVTAIAFGFSICRKENRAPFDIEQVEFIQSLQPAEWEVEFIDGKLKLRS